MKKILMSVFAIAVAATVAGVGSYALWSDTEKVNGNYVQAGYLDLQMTSVPVEIENVYPGEEGQKEITVTNNSTIPAVLSVKIDSLENFENWCIESEKNEGEDSTCSLQTDMSVINQILASHNYVGGINTGNGTNDYGHHLGRGELAENIIIDSVEIGGQTIPVNKTLYSLYHDYQGQVLGAYTMTAGQSETITINWSVNNSSMPFEDNIFMTDAVRGVFTAVLTQA